jgi:SNARE domain
MNSDRRGQAQSVLQDVNSRSKAIRKLEKDVEVIMQLFQDLEAAVIQQEPAVTQIEQRGEEVTEHVAQANTELTTAVKSAAAARRKKWWCLGIVGKFFNSIVISIELISVQCSSLLLLRSLWQLWSPLTKISNSGVKWQRRRPPLLRNMFLLQQGCRKILVFEYLYHAVVGNRMFRFRPGCYVCFL